MLGNNPELDKMKIRLSDMMDVAYSKGMEVGYQKGIDECSSNEEAYDRGLRDAWGCARAIARYYTPELLDIDDPREAMEKIRELESRPTKEDTRLKVGLRGELESLADAWNCTYEVIARIANDMMHEGLE